MDDSIGVGLGILYSESSVTLIQTLLSFQHKLYLISPHVSLALYGTM